jgi:hypothetical protein
MVSDLQTQFSGLVENTEPTNVSIAITAASVRILVEISMHSRESADQAAQVLSKELRDADAASTLLNLEITATPNITSKARGSEDVDDETDELNGDVNAAQKQSGAATGMGDAIALVIPSIAMVIFILTCVACSLKHRNMLAKAYLERRAVTKAYFVTEVAGTNTRRNEQGMPGPTSKGSTADHHENAEVQLAQERVARSESTGDDIPGKV